MQIDALVAPGAADGRDFEAFEQATRRKALDDAARALERRLNADHTDYGGPTVACACGQAARYAGQRRESASTMCSATAAFHFRNIRRFFGEQFSVSPGGQFRMSLDTSCSPSEESAGARRARARSGGRWPARSRNHGGRGLPTRSPWPVNARRRGRVGGDVVGRVGALHGVGGWSRTPDPADSRCRSRAAISGSDEPPAPPDSASHKSDVHPAGRRLPRRQAKESTERAGDGEGDPEGAQDDDGRRSRPGEGDPDHPLAQAGPRGRRTSSRDRRPGPARLWRCCRSSPPSASKLRGGGGWKSGHKEGWRAPFLGLFTTLQKQV